MSAQKISILVALVASALIFAAPADARNDCRHKAHDCRPLHQTGHHMRQRDWYLHRPSTPRERAETRALNHQELASVTMPPQRGDRSQMQYQRELREYRAAQQRYERDMRIYTRQPRDMRDGRNFPAANRHRPVWPEDLDNDPCAPTGGRADPSIAAPVNLDSAATGLTQFNARASGKRRSCEPRH